MLEEGGGGPGGYGLRARQQKKIFFAASLNKHNKTWLLIVII